LVLQERPKLEKVLLQAGNQALIQTGDSPQPKLGFWRLEEVGVGKQLLIIDVPVRQVKPTQVLL
jgi:hypothetical protein